jgi:uncharacterized protein (TIGR03435 family)
MRILDRKGAGDRDCNALAVRNCRASLRVGAVLLGFSSVLFGQADKAPMAAPITPYDVASIRVSHLTSGSGRASASIGAFSAENVTLKSLIRYAYLLPQQLLVGGPTWINDTKFNIVAKTEGVAPIDRAKLSIDQREVNEEQRLAPLQKLLEERFQLKVHHEDRLMPMYALVVAKGGIKMKPSNENSNLGDLQNVNLSGAMGVPGLRPVGKGKVIAARVTIDQLAKYLTEGANGDIDRPVVNKTGLSSQYDFALEWTPGLNPDDASSAPSLFTAIQEQLGLKLEPQRGQVVVTVIDHAELPSEN